MAPILARIKSLFSPSSTKAATTTNSDSAVAPPPPSSTTTSTAPIPTTTVTPPTPLILSPASTDTTVDPLTQAMAPVDQQAVQPTPAAAAAFHHSQVTVIFVLGGPGAGKGTQCARLVKDYGFVHLSAGDLLRAEQARPDSSVGKMIKEYITEGKIVPMEVTIKLLENAMREAMQSGGQSGKEASTRFLVDGFPRQMDQAVKFDESVCPSSLVLFLVCPEHILLERLLERGKTSGRDDDNAESIKKRFQTFINTSMPVVEYYKKQGKVVEIDSSKSIEDVYADIVKGVEPVVGAVKA